MGSERIERRAVPRSIYTGQALVFLHNKTVSCRALDISAQGCLLVPPSRAPVGTFLRMHLSLPGLDEVLDIDGLVVREARVDGYYAWGIVFHQPSERSRAVLGTFVEWVRESMKSGRQVEADFATSGSLAAIREKGTGPQHEAVRTARAREAGDRATSKGPHVAGSRPGAQPARSPAPANLRDWPSGHSAPSASRPARASQAADLHVSASSKGAPKVSSEGPAKGPSKVTRHAPPKVPKVPATDVGPGRESDELRELYRMALAELDDDAPPKSRKK